MQLTYFHINKIVQDLSKKFMTGDSVTVLWQLRAHSKLVRLPASKRRGNFQS
jgi:hypothetical protein